MTSRLLRGGARAFAAVLLLPLSLFLTACDTDRLGAAAIVDGEPLPIERLQALTRDYLRVVPGADEGDVQRQIINRIIFTNVVERAAEDVDVSASGAEVAAELDNVIAQVGSRRGLIRVLSQNQEILAPAHVDEWARSRILINKIIEKVSAGRNPNDPAVGEDVTATAKAAAQSLDVEVNPRYGRWNSTDLVLTPQVGGGLSRPANERPGSEPTETPPAP